MWPSMAVTSADKAKGNEEVEARVLEVEKRYVKCT